MKTLLSVIGACLLLTLSLHGAAPVVSIRTIPPAQALERGHTSIFAVELDISSPYHINSNRPLQDYLIPTTLEFEPQPGIVFGKTVFPPAPIKNLPVSDSPMAVYEGVVRIGVEVTPSADFISREVKAAGKIRYQACNDRSCLPPVWQDFSIMLPVSVSAGSQNVVPAAGAIGAPKQPLSSEPLPAAEKQNSEAQSFGDKSLLVTFVLVFLGGLALNLTPCVYPMIPITISYFGGQAQGKKGSLIAHSSLYVIGMAATYSVLGVVAALTGGLFGAANQYPPVLFGIALVMVILALSMFDVYELRVPQWLNRLAGSSQKGLFGTFLMGLTVGIVAAPCVGPFVLGLLTYVGNRGNAILGFALFFVLAIGLGIPFLLLGIFSGSIRRLPRSGAWMVWVRKIFGFILLMMAVYFLKSLFPSLLAYNLALALIMFLGGIYLAWIDSVPGSGRIFSYVRNVVGMAFFAAALYTTVAGLQGSIGSAQVRSAAKNQGESIQWLPYSESILSRASQENKPVFIDFYADWCAPCKELDDHTFAAPEVVARSKEFIMLKVDLTSAANPQSESLRKKFQVLGVPTLIFLEPDGLEITSLRGTGFETKEVFLKNMDHVLQQKKPM